MTKEQEVLEKLLSFTFAMSENMIGLLKGNYDGKTFVKKTYEYLQKYTADRNEQKTIRQSLNRLEAIDNVKPSEALECLEKLKGMEISSMPFSDEYGTQEVDLNDIRKVGSQLNTDFREYTATIKQALLKAQEPKKYLKWEDLEFKELEFKVEQKKDFKVKLNDTEYGLEICITFGIKEALIFDEKKVLYAVFHERHKKFFNDLRLERVEE